MKATELKLDQKVVSAKEWEAARQQLLAKEKELTRARDALAAERRRMTGKRLTDSQSPKS